MPIGYQVPITQNPPRTQRPARQPSIEQPAEAQQAAIQTGVPQIGQKMDMNAAWICFQCGTNNPPYVTACSCGVTKKRAAKYYETGVDLLAAQAEADKQRKTRRDVAINDFMDKKANYGPNMLDDHETVMVDKAGNPVASSEPAAAAANNAAAAAPQTMRSKQVYNREPYFDEWKCPECGTINNDYVSTCACGCSQRKAKKLAGGNAPRTQRPAATQRPPQQQPFTLNPTQRQTQASPPVTPPPVPTTSASSGRATTSTPTGRATKNNDREPYFDEWKCPECGIINNDYVSTCACGCSQRRAKRLQQGNKNNKR